MEEREEREERENGQGFLEINKQQNINKQPIFVWFALFDRQVYFCYG